MIFAWHDDGFVQGFFIGIGGSLLTVFVVLSIYIFISEIVKDIKNRS